MRALLLSPHNLGDDESLFASFLCLRHQPHVIVCLRSYIQEREFGVSHIERELETDEAMRVLGCTWEQWEFPDTTTSEQEWAEMADRLSKLNPDRVFAPAQERLGHPEHSRIARIADEVFGRDRVTHYLSYRTGTVKTWSETMVEFESWMVFRKLSALACYRSQARTPCYRHFTEDLMEYVE